MSQNRPEMETEEYKNWRRTVFARDGFTCFVEDTQVLMGDFSRKNIQDVKTGDIVIDAYGNKQSVMATYKKFVSDNPMLSIHRVGSGDRVICTSDHKILSIKNNTYTLIPAGDLQSNTENGKRNANFVLEPKLCRDGEIYELDVAKYVRGIKYTVVDQDSIGTINSHKTIKRHIGITNDFGWLIGMFLAEGNLNKKNTVVTFTLNIKEREYAKKIESIVNNCFGAECVHREYPGRNVRIVQIMSSVTANFLRNLLYTTGDKRFLQFTWNDYALRGVLNGIVNGDGYINAKNDSVTIQMSRPDLIIDIHILSNIIGIYSLLGKTSFLRNRTMKYVKYTSSNYRNLINTMGNTDTVVARTKFEQRWYSASHIISKIKSIKPVLYTGYIYDIETSGSHTYVANGIAVSNCQLTGQRGGKLEAHHIKSWADNESLRYNISNGITLSEEAHKVVTLRPTRFEKQFEEIVMRKRKEQEKASAKTGRERRKTEEKLLGSWRPRNPRVRF
jgi:intein/homing endonuclease